WDFAPPGNGNFGPQKDAPRDSRTEIPVFVQTGNSDFSHVVFRNGLITASHTVFLPAGGPATRSAVQWWQLTADGAVVARGRLDDATGQTFYAYSSIAPNRDNDVLLGYTTYSLQQYPSAGYSFRAASDPPGALRADALLKAGESVYVKTFGGSRNRWGDYSLTAVDPANDTDLWTIQEYAALPPQPAPVSYWGTWWGRVVPDSGPSVPLPIASFGSSATAAPAGQPVAFNDTSAGATRWFWNFGDGTSASERDPVHVFQYSGVFSVILNAVNQTGAATATRSITVGPPAQAFPQPISRDRVPRRLTPRR
ncbi:MAG TPA: PKD domain-containing protein, partial [Thermoanaerobaculia bacterium]|nr:PKD domain-containing protein [Thermoanaerobaculia bacterium]